MITAERAEEIRGWLLGRVPEEWAAQTPKVTVDREEILVVLVVPDVDLAEAGEAERTSARAGRAKAFREQTREQRMAIADEAQHRFSRTVSWGVRVGKHIELFTHLAAPVMTRLRHPERLVLDTRVDAGVARSRSEALAWCVRLVSEHEHDWLAELRDALARVEQVRDRGPGG